MKTRECGSCSLCCKLLSIRELDKPIDTWCQHCRPGKGGCSIYANRPAECRSFECGWLADERIGEEWFPARCKMVLSQTDEGHLSVTVDPAFSDAWRREPYHSQLMAQPGLVVVRVGRRCIDAKTEYEVTRSQAWLEGRDEPASG
jgi:hypothetical protein